MNRMRHQSGPGGGSSATRNKLHEPNPDDIFELDLNEGFESDDDDEHAQLDDEGDHEVLDWAEQTLAAERRAQVDAGRNRRHVD